ncbi:MAG: hypothetical protein AAGI11_15075 [Pseudomonadota bacterium]
MAEVDIDIDELCKAATMATLERLDLSDGQRLRYWSQFVELASRFAPLRVNEYVRRRDDMSATGLLTLCMDDDGDACIGISKEDCDNGQHGGSVTLEFCTFMAGGGKSPHTRRALIALMNAVRLDNIEHPLPTPTEANDNGAKK